MHQKIRNLISMWGREGYNIYVVHELSKGKELTEVLIEVNRKDWEGIVFDKEWDVFKSLATRQGFYILPVIKEDSDDTVNLLLIKRSQIYKKAHELQTLLNRFNQSYWLVQEEEGVQEIANLIVELWKLIIDIQSEVKSMRSVEKTSPLANAIIHSETYHKWMSYKKGLLEFAEQVDRSSKVESGLKNEVYTLVDQYVFYRM